MGQRLIYANKGSKPEVRGQRTVSRCSKIDNRKTTTGHEHRKWSKDKK